MNKSIKKFESKKIRSCEFYVYYTSFPTVFPYIFFPFRLPKTLKFTCRIRYKETRGTNWILHIKQGPLSLFSLYTVDSNISYKETIGM